MLQSVTEYDRVLQSITECYSVLQSVTECYRVLQCVTEFYRVLHSITEYYRVLQSIFSASTWTNLGLFQYVQALKPYNDPVSPIAKQYQLILTQYHRVPVSIAI